MGCDCNEGQPGTNCQCSEPIVLASKGDTGATGATGATGTSGVVVLYNDLATVSQTGVYDGTLDTYSLVTGTYLNVNGDKIKVIVIFQTTADANGTLGIYFDGNLCGSLYTYAPGPAKVMKMEVIINRISGNSQLNDQVWDDVPSISGAVVSRFANPYNLSAVVISGTLDITVLATQTVAGESIYLRQFSVESMLLF